MLFHECPAYARSGAGDSIVFVVEGGWVWVRRAEPLDRKFARALSGTMGEWLSPADEDARLVLRIAGRPAPADTAAVEQALRPTLGCGGAHE